MYFFKNIETFFKKAIDNHLKMWYNNIVGREVKAMDNKIKELTKLLEQLDKLLTQVVKILITVGTIWAIIKGTFF